MSLTSPSKFLFDYAQCVRNLLNKKLKSSRERERVKKKKKRRRPRGAAIEAGLGQKNSHLAVQQAEMKEKKKVWQLSPVRWRFWRVLNNHSKEGKACCCWPCLAGSTSLFIYRQVLLPSRYDGGVKTLRNCTKLLQHKAPIKAHRSYVIRPVSLSACSTFVFLFFFVVQR